MNNDVGGRLYDRPASETSSRNKLNQEKVDAYEADQRRKDSDLAMSDAYDSGMAEGTNSAYMDVMQRLDRSNQYTPIMEGSPEDLIMQDNVNQGIQNSNSGNYGLLDEVSDLLTSSGQESQSMYEQQGEQSANDMREDVYENAFMTAKSMGDTSEDNINSLVTAELNKRGL